MLTPRHLVILLAFAAFLPANAATVFQEVDGLVAMEYEHATAEDLGDWGEIGTEHAGYTGEGYLEWKTGDDSGKIDKAGKGILTWQFAIDTVGEYQLHMHSRPSGGTEHNDVWIDFPDIYAYKVKKGDNKGELKNWTKMYNNGGGKWDWQTTTVDHDRHDIWISVTEPGVYTFRCSGRSTKFAVDRIVLRHADVKKDDATDLTLPESPTTGAPRVDAGANQTISVPDDQVALDGTVSDPEGDALTITWSVDSGLDGVVFADPNAVDTTVTLPGEGSWVLRLSADDGEHVGSDTVVVTVLPDMGDLQPGLLAAFADLNEEPSNMPVFDDLQVTLNRIDAQVDYASSNDPWAGLPDGFTDSFAARWSGFVLIPADGEWTFTTTSDDGSLLFIDDQQVVDNDGTHGMDDVSATVSLTAGVHALRLDYFEASAGAGCQLDWAGPDQTRQRIPASALWHRPAVDDPRLRRIQFRVSRDGSAIETDLRATQDGSTRYEERAAEHQIEDLGATSATELAATAVPISPG